LLIKTLRYKLSLNKVRAGQFQGTALNEYYAQKIALPWLAQGEGNWLLVRLLASYAKNVAPTRHIVSIIDRMVSARQIGITIENSKTLDYFATDRSERARTI
jgi:hypothetical protein